MTNELAVIETTGTLVSVVDQTILAAFGIDDARLAEIKAECDGLSFEGKAYEESCRVLAKVRTTRTSVDKRREELNAEPLERQRKNNEAAKLITAAILEIETPVAERRKLVDDAKKAEKAAKEAAVRAAEEARIRAANEAREAELRAEMEAKEKALAEAQAKIDAANAELKAKTDALEAEQAKERLRMQTEREAFDREQARIRELQEAETQRIAAETRRIAEEKRQAELAEARRLAAIEAERVARENAERERVAAKERRVAELECVAALKAREEALRPDKEKLAAFAKSIMEFTTNNAPCGIVDPSAVDAITECLTAIDDAALTLREFAE